MTQPLRIAISCADTVGILASVAARLFDLDTNLGDVSFAVLGEGAELTCVCHVPTGVEPVQVHDALASLPNLKGAEITVRPFVLSMVRTDRGQPTHVVRVRGENRPGLVARLAEVFDEFGANVVRLTAEHEQRNPPSDYLMRFEVWISRESEVSCLATAANVAERMGLTFQQERASI